MNAHTQKILEQLPPEIAGRVIQLIGRLAAKQLDVEIAGYRDGVIEVEFNERFYGDHWGVDVMREEAQKLGLSCRVAQKENHHGLISN